MLRAVTSVVLSSALLLVLPARGFGADEKKSTSGSAQNAIVLAVKATSACFSDMVRVTGFLVPRREAVVAVDQEGYRVAEVLARDGDQVTENQELVRLGGPAAAAQAAQAAQQNPQAAAGRPGTITLRAPAAGRIIQSTARAGAFASPQLGPLFRIAIDNEIELDAEVPYVHVLKLSPGVTARVTIDGGPEVSGRVRIIAPEIDRRTQLGRARVSVSRSPEIKVGMFARATIDANRSCERVSVPKSALDHSSVQVIRDNVVETRKVQVGRSSDTDIEILEGVREGEIIVANAGTSLHDGDKVKTIFPDEFDRIGR